MFVYNIINMCIYTLYIHMYFLITCVSSPQPAAHKKTPVCTFISQIWPPVITASLPVDQALNMNLNL